MTRRVRTCLQALAELFCRVAGHRASAHHQVLVGHQDLGALVAGALGALKLQVLPGSCIEHGSLPCPVLSPVTLAAWCHESPTNAPTLFDHIQ